MWILIDAVCTITFILFSLVTSVFLLFRKSLGDGLAWSVHIKTVCGRNLVELERNGSVLMNKVSTVQLKPYLQREDSTKPDVGSNPFGMNLGHSEDFGTVNISWCRGYDGGRAV